MDTVAAYSANFNWIQTKETKQSQSSISIPVLFSISVPWPLYSEALLLPVITQAMDPYLPTPIMPQHSTAFCTLSSSWVMLPYCLIVIIILKVQHISEYKAHHFTLSHFTKKMQLHSETSLKFPRRKADKCDNSNFRCSINGHFRHSNSSCLN